MLMLLQLTKLAYRVVLQGKFCDTGLEVPAQTA